MKKSKLKSLVKTARKNAQKEFQVAIVAELKVAAGKLGQDIEKLNKNIEKEAKKASKRIAQKIKIDKNALVQSNDEAKAVAAVESV
jgi:predicted RNA-binding protein with PIN domain